MDSPRKSVRSPGEVVEAFRKKFPQETGVGGHAPSYILWGPRTEARAGGVWAP